MTDLRRDISLFASVARIEASLANSRMELQKLPVQIQKIDKTLAELEARQQAATARVEKVSAERRDTERAMQEHEAHLKKSRNQQSLVKTNTEYTAMLKEIANLETQIGEDEERILVLMDELEAAQKETADATTTLETERDGKLKEREVLEQRVAELKAEVEQLTAEQPKILSDIAPVMRKRYERLKERFGEVAVTRLDNEYCGGCGTQVPPQVAVEVRKCDQFITCPACGRILVHYAD
jgi:predicted  nucleic acid-binding Zn-ribbon protein